MDSLKFKAPNSLIKVSETYLVGINEVLKLFFLSSSFTFGPITANFTFDDSIDKFNLSNLLKKIFTVLTLVKITQSKLLIFSKTEFISAPFNSRVFIVGKITGKKPSSLSLLEKYVD